MIKAVGNSTDGTQVLLLGLTGENVTRLVANEPLYISAKDMAAMGLPAIHLGVVYGKTEADAMQSFQALGGEIEGRTKADL